ncbi:MAG: hypothetical protein GXP27_03440, partial [Planctomycetes bacterium]|nr:hypothetical protein [Planctomycetota bacterium]
MNDAFLVELRRSRRRLAIRRAASGPHQWARVFLIVAVILALTLWRPATGWSQTQTLTGEDLLISVSSRWAGGGQGGYHPVRFQVVNRGKSRTLTFRISPIDRRYLSLPTVQRTISIESGAAVRFTLNVPLVGAGGYAVLSVHDERGRRVRSLSGSSLNLAEPMESTVGLLVIAPRMVDCGPFEDAVEFLNRTAGKVYWRGRSRTGYAQAVTPDSLPDSWISYSGLDLVAISLETFEKLSSARRSALLDWVRQGGNLIVYDVGEDPQGSRRLDVALELSRQAAVAANWRRVRAQEYPGFKIEQEQSEHTQPRRTATPSAKKAGGGRLLTHPEWPAKQNLFSIRKLMLGQIIAFPRDPFPGTPNDWAWLLSVLTKSRYDWAWRHGLTARDENPNFLEFLIPGIRTVPAKSFVVLITLFTLVIGPVNFFFLKRRNRLYLVLLTIPLIAFLTSMTLFAYSVVAHGVSVRSRVRSLTVVDQKAKRSVTVARVALYAGLAPSEGLRFLPETAVYPIWPPEQSFQTGVVDWTSAQHLRSGWLASRTRTQFLVTTCRAERGRLDVSPPKDGQLTIANGFEWKLT